MKLTQQEVTLVFFSLNQSKDGSPRKFHFAELAKVNALAAKLDLCVKDGRIEDKEPELDLTTEEKAFILERVKELDWQTGDAKYVLSLVEKLG